MTISTVLFGALAALSFSWTGLTAPTTPFTETSQAARACNPETFKSLLKGSSQASVESVTSVREGGSYGEGSANIAYPYNPTGLPQLCAVIIRVKSSCSSGYRFGLFLPSASTWNSRFLAVGNGGFAGGINWLDMGVGPHYGFATISTDTGHNSSVIDIAWANGQPEKKADWGWRGLHGSVVLAKDLIQSYYDKPLRYSYYSGCSTGGRQGLRELQEFPESFDGALIGAPSWQTSHLNNFVTPLGMYNLPVGAPNYIPLSLFPALAAEVIRQCDTVDGFADGIVSTLDKCNFDYSTINCKNPDVDPSACLTDEQIQTARNIYSDYFAPNGTFLSASYSLSSELQWPIEMGGTEPSPFGVGYQRHFLLDDANWDWHNYNVSLVDLAASTDPGRPTADKYDISSYKKRGGKIFMYHGIADAVVPPRATAVYYNRTIEAFGGLNQTTDFFRFFLVPGMQHCYLTPTNAPWHFGAASQASMFGTAAWSVPNFKDEKHDALLALMKWVEQKQPVGSIVATAYRNGTNTASGVLRQRPLCPWPQMAVYKGTGDVDTASNWQCR